MSVGNVTDVVRLYSIYAHAEVEISWEVSRKNSIRS